MDCPYCGHKESKVTNKRDAEKTIRRRRECLACKKRFTTHEKIELGDMYVIKKDGRRELFNRDKLLLGIVKACEKRPISHEKIEEIVTEIEEIARKRGKEISTRNIGDLVIKKLKKIDPVAYIRFASVYREFKDIRDFREVVKEVS